MALSGVDGFPVEIVDELANERFGHRSPLRCLRNGRDLHVICRIRRPRHLLDRKSFGRELLRVTKFLGATGPALASLRVARRPPPTRIRKAGNQCVPQNRVQRISFGGTPKVASRIRTLTKQIPGAHLPRGYPTIDTPIGPVGMPK